MEKSIPIFLHFPGKCSDKQQYPAVRAIAQMGERLAEHLSLAVSSQGQEMVEWSRAKKE